jgi:hypothetical protein
MTHRNGYTPAIVTACFTQAGLPAPVFEHRFHPTRKWRLDIAWPEHLVYLEVDGGIWIKGGHNRGAQMKKDWEKRNAASGMGWRGLWCEPKDLLKAETVEAVRAALCACSHSPGLSVCCGAPVRVAGDLNYRLGTMWHECVKCGEPTDTRGDE